MGQEDLRFVFIHPDEATGRQIKDFKTVADSGGESFMENFEYKLLYTVELMGFCYDDNKLVGIRALKTPSLEQVKSYMVKVGRPDLHFKYELGYAAVLPEARGRGIYQKLTEGMLEYLKEPAYIVTRKENHPVIHTMSKLGFETIGCEFPSIIDQSRLLVIMVN